MERRWHRSLATLKVWIVHWPCPVAQQEPFSWSHSTSLRKLLYLFLWRAQLPWHVIGIYSKSRASPHWSVRCFGILGGFRVLGRLKQFSLTCSRIKQVGVVAWHPKPEGQQFRVWKVLKVQVHPRCTHAVKSKGRTTKRVETALTEQKNWNYFASRYPQEGIVVMLVISAVYIYKEK